MKTSDMGAPYFAVDPLTAAMAGDMLEVWERAQKHLGDAWLYALVDAAFVEDTWPAYLAKRKAGSAVSLYAGTEFAEMTGLSPWLVRMSRSGEPASYRADVAALCELRAGRPMLSFIASSRSLVQLQLHFRSFLQVTVGGEGPPLLLRFADTRVIEPLLRTFTAEQRAAFLPPDVGLWFPGRTAPRIGGTLPDRARSMVEASAALDLSEQQFSALMQASEADLVIQGLTAIGTNRFERRSPSGVHAFVERQIARAHAHGLRDTPDLVAYCNAAWHVGPLFDEHPEFQFAIRKASRGTGELHAHLTTVPTSAWDDARRKGAP